MWYYSALNYESLNQHLRTTLVLADPYNEKKEIPLSMQKKLLLPFGNIKDLDSVLVLGYDPGLDQELRRLMDIPYDSPQKCCEDATALLEAGDRAIVESRPSEALQLYTKSFHAIHILIDGRERRVLADHFFHHHIHDGRYKGQSGTTVRIILRIMLVSRFVNAYLKLHQYSEAAFWGMRSICIMRDTIGRDFEDFLAEITGMHDAGILYVRTSIAMHRLEEANAPDLITYYDTDGFGKSEKLLYTAGQFLKGDNRSLIKKELQDHGMKMPDSAFFCGSPDSLASLERVEQSQPAEQDAAEQSHFRPLHQSGNDEHMSR
jgi:hypothetical protein